MTYDKKIAIVYKTKYGSTMKYAGWLAMKLDADLYEISDVGRWDLLKYKTIIFGSPIYNSKLYLANYLKEKYNTIQSKNIILFCTGLDLQSREDIINNNFEDKEMINKIKFFFLEGSINFDDLSIIDKAKLKIYNRTNYLLELKNLERSINIDRSYKHTITPIVDYAIHKTY